MTNAEKYLKDGVKEKFIKEINAELDISFDQFNVKEWLQTPYKPTLTEDERVILKNIDTKNFKTIGRNKISLYLGYGHEEEKDCFINYLFNHLFQFIKERRRI